MRSARSAPSQIRPTNNSPWHLKTTGNKGGIYKNLKQQCSESPAKEKITYDSLKSCYEADKGKKSAVNGIKFDNAGVQRLFQSSSTDKNAIRAQDYLKKSTIMNEKQFTQIMTGVNDRLKGQSRNAQSAPQPDLAPDPSSFKIRVPQNDVSKPAEVGKNGPKQRRSFSNLFGLLGNTQKKEQTGSGKTPQTNSKMYLKIIIFLVIVAGIFAALFFLKDCKQKLCDIDHDDFFRPGRTSIVKDEMTYERGENDNKIVREVLDDDFDRDPNLAFSIVQNTNDKKVYIYSSRQRLEFCGITTTKLTEAFEKRGLTVMLHWNVPIKNYDKAYVCDNQSNPNRDLREATQIGDTKLVSNFEECAAECDKNADCRTFAFESDNVCKLYNEVWTPQIYIKTRDRQYNVENRQNAQRNEILDDDGNTQSYDRKWSFCMNKHAITANSVVAPVVPDASEVSDATTDDA